VQTRQLWLNLAPKGGAYRRETFVEGSSNVLARKALDHWQHWPGNVLALSGPAGCGKSHLAHLWAKQSGARTVNLANVPRQVKGALLIEDLPGQMDEPALFRLINEAALSHIQLLLTSHTPPRSWPVQLPDLISRLSAMHTVAIDEPDDTVLTGILKKLFADRQIAVEQNVIDFLLSRMERSSAAALSTVERIHNKGHDQKQNIRLPLVRTVIKEIEQEKQMPDLFDTIKTGHSHE
jgi:chromosomal replication initiation ATPase DnaA